MTDILIYAILGFFAQMIDGCLGMAYGVSLTTFLLTIGVPPALASASVHTSEVVTTGVSGLAHLGFGNVDKEIFKRLVIPGMFGGAAGAYILTTISGDVIEPLVAAYLVIMGVRIIMKAFQQRGEATPMTRLVPLGLIGGFLDAIGGGGWGPVVTSTLVADGHQPRFAIGSVNLAEFFVTLVQTATFLVVLGTVHWRIVIGLIAGGVVAAPLAAYLSKRLSPRRLMIVVGALVILLSLRTVYLTLTS